MACSVLPSSVEINPALTASVTVIAVSVSSAQKSSDSLTITGWPENGNRAVSVTVALLIQ
ncbi:MAG TPA: hypothetical protein VMT20_25780 [Terriglobia bacterium]|nr:hypothetical protein [Terriglobia bacterium]